MESTNNFDCKEKIRSLFRRWKQTIIKYVKPKEKDLRIWNLVASCATLVYFWVLLNIFMYYRGNIENPDHNNSTSLTLSNRTTIEKSKTCDDLKQKLGNSTIADQLEYHRKQVSVFFTLTCMCAVLMNCLNLSLIGAKKECNYFRRLWMISAPPILIAIKLFMLLYPFPSEIFGSTVIFYEIHKECFSWYIYLCIMEVVSSPILFVGVSEAFSFYLIFWMIIAPPTFITFWFSLMLYPFPPEYILYKILNAFSIIPFNVILLNVADYFLMVDEDDDYLGFLLDGIEEINHIRDHPRILLNFLPSLS